MGTGVGYFAPLGFSFLTCKMGTAIIELLSGLTVSRMKCEAAADLVLRAVPGPQAGAGRAGRTSALAGHPSGVTPFPPLVH